MASHPMAYAYDTYLSVAYCKGKCFSRVCTGRMLRACLDAQQTRHYGAAHFLEYAWEKHSLKNQFFPMEKVLALHIHFQYY